MLPTCCRGTRDKRNRASMFFPPDPPLPFVKNPLRSIRELTFQSENLIKHELPTCWRHAAEVPATSETERLCSSPKPPLPSVKDPLRSIRELTFQGENLIKHELPTCCRHAGDMLPTCWRHAGDMLPRYPRQAKSSVQVLPPRPPSS